VKAVAQRDHRLWRVASNDDSKPRQRRRGVVGGQQHAARRKARTLLQMQVGNREQPCIGPIERAVTIEHQRHPGDGHLCSPLPAANLVVAGRRRFLRARFSHSIASFTSRASASANSTSDASP